MVRIARKELRAFRLKRALELDVSLKIPVVEVNGAAQNVGIDRNDLEYLQEYLSAYARDSPHFHPCLKPI